MVSTKMLGAVVMLLALVMGALGYTYARSAESALLAGHRITDAGDCLHPEGAKCAYEEINRLAVPKFVGMFLTLLVFGAGVGLFVWKKPDERALVRAKKEASRLGGDEGRAMQVLTDAGGLMYQHELMQKLDVSKVRMTRVLDRLEQGALVERKRRGMTNVVVLKS